MADNLKKALWYIENVQNGSITASRWVKLAVQRHLEDKKKSKSNKFGFFFDDDSAKRVLDVFGVFRHGKGKWRGSPFDLMPWQAFILYCVYGWKRKSDKKRRFRTVYIKVARKNAKTEFLAAVGNIGFYFEGEPDAEIYWFATKKDQAKIGWDRQKEMVLQLRGDSSRFSTFCDTSKYRIYTQKGTGFVAYLGADSDTEDGLSPHYGLCDEYHAHKNDGMVNVIESGMGSRENPMMWFITTAGFNPQSPCALFEKSCKQILDGVKDNDNIFALIYDLDEEDDWEDSNNWIKANPALPYIDTLEDFLFAEYAKAKTQGQSKIINFKTKNLNMWMTSSATWIKAEDWKACETDVDYESLKGKRCYGGLDLASTRDITALCYYFPVQEGLEEPVIIWSMWCPEDQAQERERNDGIPYRQWAADYWINLTPGNVTDYGYIKEQIQADSEFFQIESIAYDRWNSSQLVIDLLEAGAQMRKIGQGFASMSAPTKQLETEILQGKIRHDGNPVMAWMMSNVDLKHDPAGNIKPDKDKSSEKIDGVVAMVMARAEAMDLETDAGSFYNNNDLLFV